jgi:murein DD-endopeptidase MepM/ murein hydrolase activator NlpD
MFSPARARDPIRHNQPRGSGQEEQGMTAPFRIRVWLGSLALAASTPVLAGTGTASDTGQGRTVRDGEYVYRLPYADGQSYSVIQSYGSPLSHRGLEYYTIDFGMPEGTPVYSAREGRVERVEDRFDRACWKAGCAGYANFVEIRHPDGTLGRYFHLEQGSVIVEPGQWVDRGEPIARSGDTGYSTSPHLHFGVYRTVRDGVDQSIAIRFAVREGFVGHLRTGARYTNRID